MTNVAHRLKEPVRTRKPKKADGGGRYTPPNGRSILVSEALNGTTRFPVAQYSLFDDAQNSSDTTIFYSGDISLLQRRCIAIVGTRKVSNVGKMRTSEFASFLASSGIVVISGLAAGVDTAALRSAIDAGGKVVAVIGTPLDKSYPAENKRLQEEIYRDHLLISQFPIGANVWRSNFPRRNKLMAFPVRRHRGHGSVGHFRDPASGRGMR